MKLPSIHLDPETGGGTGGGGEAGGAGGTTLLAGAGATGGAPAGAGGGTGAAAGSPWFSDDTAGTFSPGWLERLDPDLRANPSLASVPTLKDLAKSYVATKALVGTKLEMPGEGATPEQVAAWRKTVGAPEKPEGYLGDAKTLRPETVPEAFWNPEVEKKFLEIAHRHHLTSAAVKEIIAYHGSSIKGSLDASQAQEGEVLTAELGKLRQDWGQEFDTNLNLASRVAATVGLKDSDPIFTNAYVVQAFAKLGKLFSEDKLVQGENRGINGSVDDRIREITDPGSTGALARDYRGENGSERQVAAQKQLHELMGAREKK